MKFYKGKCSFRFFLFIGLAFFTLQLPVLGNYLRNLNTLIHETGHALIALFSGQLNTISLLINGDGITQGRQSIWIIDFLTSASGYIFSSFMAYFSFWLIKQKKYTILIDILLGFIVVNLILWVRNPYGLFWLASFGLLFLSLLIKGNQKLINNLLIFLASVLLVESIITAYDILVISLIHPESAGDAANLSNLSIVITPQIWGIFFFVQSLVFLYVGFKKGFFNIGEEKPSAQYQIEGLNEAKL